MMYYNSSLVILPFPSASKILNDCSTFALERRISLFDAAIKNSKTIIILKGYYFKKCLPVKSTLPDLFTSTSSKILSTYTAALSLSPKTVVYPVLVIVKHNW